MTLLSVVAPSVPAHPREWDATATLIRSTSMHRLWVGQSYGLDSTAMLARLAGRGLAVPCGSSVMVAGLTDPRRAAGEARSIAAMTGHPFLHGIGPGSRAVQHRLRPDEPAMRLDDLRRYVETLRTELDPTRPGLLEPIATPPVHVGLGVLRPRAAALAGEIADAWLSWMAPATYLAETIVPTVHAAAASHRRPAPHGMAMVAVGVDRPGRDRWAMAHLAVGGHIRQPHYRDAVRRSGIQIHDDYERTIASLLRHRLFVYGTADEIADHLHETYGAAGVDEIALMTIATTNLYGADATYEDLADIEAAFAHRSSTSHVERRAHA
ncbi:LLM class flavin-dependent oxidoreductase [uncultured Williamsia sp.]|uniref:LLM class flavin-dependent oxidoreductase n=1 Tax=uncultured Williamsia sp. TaxID=259311 RepID=UPI00262A33B7|nr:LLM class flavin-dependent oxidoreductase [uncultured Williamsia sp.]